MSTGLASCTDVERLLLHSCKPQPRRTPERLTLDYKLVVEPPLLSATITDLCNEPLFSNTYQSDEEDFSASETDDMSFSSGTSTSVRDEDIADDFDRTLPELLAEECTFVEQQCSKAQAVMVVAAGRPKMIQVVNHHSMPALSRSSTSASRIFQRSISSKNGIHTLGSGRTHGYGFSRTSSINSQSVPSTPDFPSTPQLEYGLRTPMSACTPLTPGTPNSRSRFDRFMSTSPSDEFTTPTSKQPCSVRPQIVRRSKTSFPSLGGPAPPLSAPLTAPAIYSYAPKPVARGANERKPIMELPPFPSDAVMHTIKPTRPWVLRKDSFGPVLDHRDSSKSEKSRMRKVESVLSLKRR